MTDDTIHTCSYYCERPECIKRQRDELRDRMESSLAQQPAAGDECHCGTCTCDPNMTPAVRFDLSPAQMEGAIRDHLIRLGWTPPDEPAVSQQPEERGGGAAEPTSAPVGVDFAAVASILRRAMRDGVHYGYRRDFILQQALALEALSQQPAAVDEAVVEAVARAICVACEENPDRQGDARGNEFRWQDYRDTALAAISALAAQQQGGA